MKESDYWKSVYICVIFLGLNKLIFFGGNLVGSKHNLLQLGIFAFVTFPVDVIQLEKIIFSTFYIKMIQDNNVGVCVFHLLSHRLLMHR